MNGQELNEILEDNRWSLIKRDVPIELLSKFLSTWREWTGGAGGHSYHRYEDAAEALAKKLDEIEKGKT